MGGEQSNLWENSQNPILQAQMKRADPQKEYKFQIPVLGSGFLELPTKSSEFQIKKSSA
jgi:hypothetical protein